MSNKILLKQNEDGTWGKFEPYTTIVIETKEDFDRLQEALEKQKPKKPDLEGDGYADGQLVYDTWICPCCGKRYEVDYDDYNHCPECGQAIDWSKEDEQ